MSDRKEKEELMRPLGQVPTEGSQDERQPPFAIPVVASISPSPINRVDSGKKTFAPSSRSPSQCTSPTMSETSDELPSDVCTEKQLRSLPPECLSGDKERPLRHVDEWDQVSHHALQPMFYSVIFILVVEMFERFAFYGVNYTQASYLTGVYNENWNADMDAVSASTCVSISVAVAYTTPFLGAYVADQLLGHYWGMLFGCLLFYIPGLLLIAFTTIPGFLGEEFNRPALITGFLVLWPLGTGTVKSIVNVFGAKQFHPLLQASLIESYYINFYMCINIGALIGGIVVPVVAQHNVILAYFLPVLMLSLGVLLFALGTPRYVRNKAKKVPVTKQATTETINFGVIFRITVLTVPFNVAYSQMSTVFIVQGTVMEKSLGFIDAACMNNADAVAVLFFGTVISSRLYPWLAKNGIKIPTAYKFAIGSALGVLAIGWALLVDWMIHREFKSSGEKISVLWQAVSYILIGVGEIFAVSSAYEAAFTASPPDKKALASAVNLFFIGSVPNILCIMLYNVCQSWFRNSRGTMQISRLEDYTSAHVSRYFWVLVAISLTGVIVNVLPQVKDFISTTEEKATDLLKSPKTPVRRSPSEESPMLRVKRHHAYLKYGSGPQLYKQGSMRAGPTLSRGHGASERHVKRTMLSTLYRNKSDRNRPTPPMPVLSTGGKPMMAGALMKGPAHSPIQKPALARSLSR